MGKWTSINTDVLGGKRYVIHESVLESNEVEESLAMSEAIDIAYEGRGLVRDLIESITNFNIKAEKNDWDGMTYINEAFEPKGFLKTMFNILIKFWGAIVAYIKTTGAKFIGTGDLNKRLKAVADEANNLLSRKFYKNDKVKFKKFPLTASFSVASVLLNANTYMNMKLKDEDAKSTLLQITAEATQIAGSDLKFDRKADGGKQEVSSSDLSLKTNSLNDLNGRLMEIIKIIGIGGVGGAGYLNSILAKSGLAENKVTKPLMISPEVAKAKSPSDLLKNLLLKLFPADCPMYETADLLGELKYIIQRAAMINDQSKNSQLDNSKNTEAINVNGFEEAKKQAQDILDQLKEAANKIGNFKADDVEEKKDEKIEEPTAPGGEEGTGDKKPLKSSTPVSSKAEDLAGTSSKLSANLTEVQNSAQEALLKGMEAGTVLIKTILAELEYRVKTIGAIGGGRGTLRVEKKETATDDNHQ